MKTSALIVELAVVGFQVLIWLTLLVWLLGPPELPVNVIKSFTAPLTLVLLPVAYTLGLIFDAFTAFVEDAIPTNLWDKSRRSQGEVMADLMITDPAAHHQIYSRQLQSRLLRSTALNSLLIAATSVPLIVTAEGITHKTSYVLLITALVVLALLAWWRRLTRYIKELARIDDRLLQKAEDDSD